jgi:hypothetical protein
MNRKRQDLQRRRLGIIDRPSVGLRVFAPLQREFSALPHLFRAPSREITMQSMNVLTTSPISRDLTPSAGQRCKSVCSTRAE